MSLMKRVSDRDSTSIPEAQSETTPSAASPSRVPRGKGADMFSVLQSVQRRMMIETDGVLNIKDEALMRQTIEELMTVILTEEAIMLNRAARQELLESLINEILGFGPLEQLLSDTSTTDIMVIGPERVYVERKGRIYRTNVQFRDDAHLMRIIDRILAPLGRRVDESSPMVDARMPDGSRINAVVPPVALDGAVLTVRKFSVIPLSVEDLIEFGTATEQVFEFLRAAVIAGMNIIVAGGSSSGKTTLLNVMSGFIPSDERIVTIENAAELQLRQAHVVRLESRPANLEGAGEISIRDLVINSLRMRPDRIVVGEVRAAEAIDLLQAMNTGHEGSMGTLHANSPQDSLSRLETMVLGAGMNLPVRAIREQMASAINIIVHMGRSRDGARRILKIAEVNGIEGDMISLSEVFRFEQTPGAQDGILVATGLMPRCIDRINDAGIHLSAALFQPMGGVTSSSGRIKTVQSSSDQRAVEPSVPQAPSPMARPEPVQYQEPAAPPPPVNYAELDDLLGENIHTMETEQDVRLFGTADDFLAALNAEAEPTEEAWQSEEEYSDQQYGQPPSGTITPPSKGTGLLGRLGTNQGTDDHDHH